MHFKQTYRNVCVLCEFFVLFFIFYLIILIFFRYLEWKVGKKNQIMQLLTCFVIYMELHIVYIQCGVTTHYSA